MLYPEYKKIPTHLRKYRLVKKLKQREVAKALGLTDQSKISHWENGVCLPSLVNAIKLSAAYGVLVDALFIDHRIRIVEEVRSKLQEILDYKE